jgi:hypothetical protein
MKKITLSLIAIGVAIFLLSCESSFNEEVNTKEETFIYKDKSYTVSFLESNSEATLLPGKDNLELMAILENPTSGVYIVEEGVYYVYLNEEELKEVMSIDDLSSEASLKSTTFTLGLLTVYKDANYENKLFGPCAILSSGMSSLDCNDQISSYTLSGGSHYLGTAVTFYEDTDFGGHSFSVRAATSKMVFERNLSDNKMSGSLWWKKYWNDRISSIKMY